MTGDDFAREVVTIHEGQQLTFFNNSNVIHVLGAGRDGRVVGHERGVPIRGYHLMPTNSVYRTPPWTKPGTFWLTCSVHPDMTVKVIVRP